MVGNRQSANIYFNMAPMIDVVFLLIIFFMLVSTFASAENIPMELPNPERSLAQNVKIVDRVVINCRTVRSASEGEPDGALYSIGPNRPEPLESIARRLEAAHAANPKLKVIIRADKRLRYEQVRAVMVVVAQQEIEDMSLVAHVSGLDE
ncbi:MAG: biopolymer transporter ExbD [Planctomycetes bacterium]|nr:biopolymer transporter ExbD [Planctomycetota bacterium]